MNRIKRELNKIRNMYKEEARWLFEEKNLPNSFLNQFNILWIVPSLIHLLLTQTFEEHSKLLSHLSSDFNCDSKLPLSVQNSPVFLYPNG
jgi:hypothetical protein